MQSVRRHLIDRVLHLLTVFPVVVIAGARQVGKSTLAKAVLEEMPGTYLSLDEAALFDSARLDPRAIVRRDGFTVIDEVQLAPDLLREVKVAVDADRSPGRYLLTGSANLLKMKSVTESLAGRSAWVDLGPFTWSELAGAPAPVTVDAMFAATDTGADAIAALPAAQPRSDETARRLAVRGAMPAALLLDDRDRRDFYDAYRLTFIERDLRQLARVEDLQAFGRVLVLAMGRTSKLVNVSDLAADAGVSPPTARSYLDLLETGCQVRTLPAYFVNTGKRLRKAPKVLARDCGFAAHVAGVRSWEDAQARSMDGALMETFAISELIALAGLSETRPSALYWRTGRGAEVDLVLERGPDVVGIEVKSSMTPRYEHARSLMSLRDDLGGRFRIGIVAHLGDEIREMHDRVWAVPLAALLGGCAVDVVDL